MSISRTVSLDKPWSRKREGIRSRSKFQFDDKCDSSVVSFTTLRYSSLENESSTPRENLPQSDRVYPRSSNKASSSPIDFRVSTIVSEDCWEVSFSFWAWNRSNSSFSLSSIVGMRARWYCSLTLLVHRVSSDATLKSGSTVNWCGRTFRYICSHKRSHSYIARANSTNRSNLAALTLCPCISQYFRVISISQRIDSV